MPANIVETAQFAISPAHHKQRFTDYFGGEIIARIRHLVRMPNNLPGPRKYLLLLGCEYFPVDVKR